MDANFEKNLKIYVSEAAFFERVLMRQIHSLNQGSHVVEIGAGIGALALRIASHGFEVTAFEPQSAGFSHMYEMRKHLIGQNPQDISVSFRDEFLDKNTKLEKPADLILAINVIEHVPDIRGLISNALKIKSPQGSMRIICPNYAIPYEPHFEIPTLFLKKITFKVFRKQIERSNLEDPIGFWHDLSWPTQRSLKKLFTEMNLDFEFKREGFSHYINRALGDELFTERKGPIIGKMIWVFAILFQKISSLIPISLIPIIDLNIYGEKSKSDNS